jgi:hypothetical protein
MAPINYGLSDGEARGGWGLYTEAMSSGGWITFGLSVVEGGAGALGVDAYVARQEQVEARGPIALLVQHRLARARLQARFSEQRVGGGGGQRAQLGDVLRQALQRRDVLHRAPVRPVANRDIRVCVIGDVLRQALQRRDVLRRAPVRPKSCES